MDLMPTGDWIEPVDEDAVAAARRLTDRIKVAMEGTWQLIQEAYLTRAWSSLGYVSWDAYCAAEFPSAKLRLPREERQEVVASMRESGMSLRAISSATGVSPATAMRDARVSDETPSEVTGVDGKTYQPQQTTVADHAPMETVTPTVTQPKRKPLPAAFDDAALDLGKSTERLARLTGDDRFDRNRAQTHHRVPELLSALTTATGVLTAMNLAAADASEEARRWWATSLNNLSQTLAGLAESINPEGTNL